MYELSAVDLGLALTGAPGTSDLGWGLSVKRLPAWAVAQCGDPAAMDASSSMPSGARLHFRTRATWIELSAIFTVLADGNANAPMPVRTLALTTETSERIAAVPDVVVRSVPPGGILEPRDDGARSIRFDVPASADEQDVSVWLPHNCAVIIKSVTSDRRLTPARPAGPRWTHYGSSISQCGGASSPLGVWPVIAARELGLSLTSLGLAGQAHLDQSVARTIRDVPAEVISLKIGINVVNAASLRSRTFVPAVHGFLDTIREKQLHTPILVISPIYCPAHEDAPGPTIGIDGYAYSAGLPFAPGDGQLTLREIRRLLRELVEERAQSDANIHYLDGLRLFDRQDLEHMPDGLHPNAQGYRLMGARFVDAARELFP